MVSSEDPLSISDQGLSTLCVCVCPTLGLGNSCNVNGGPCLNVGTMT